MCVCGQLIKSVEGKISPSAKPCGRKRKKTEEAAERSDISPIGANDGEAGEAGEGQAPLKVPRASGGGRGRGRVSR